LTSKGLFFLRFFLKPLCALTVMIKLLLVMIAGTENRTFVFVVLVATILLLLDIVNAPAFFGK
jgi:hypothetical protein